MRMTESITDKQEKGTATKSIRQMFMAQIITMRHVQESNTNGMSPHLPSFKNSVEAFIHRHTARINHREH